MVIRESKVPFLELDLSGSASELRGIAAAIAALREGEVCKFSADLAADPTPYQRCLATFEIAASGGPVRLTVDGNALRATGSPDMLKKFASFFEFADDHCPGDHTHYEWYDGSPYSTEDSRPLVVSAT